MQLSCAVGNSFFRAIFVITVLLMYSLKVIFIKTSFLAKKGLILKIFQNPFPCIYTGLVDMLLANFVEIDRNVFCPALHTDLHFVNNLFCTQKTPKRISKIKSQLKLVYDHYTFSIQYYNTGVS